MQVSIYNGQHGGGSGRHFHLSPPFQKGRGSIGVGNDIKVMCFYARVERARTTWAHPSQLHDASNLAWPTLFIIDPLK